MVVGCQDNTEVEVGPRILGIDFDGFTKHGDALVRLLVVPQGKGEVGVCPRILGIDFDGFAILGDGLIHLLVVPQG